MSAPATTRDSPGTKPRSRRRRWLWRCLWLLATMIAVLVALVIALFVWLQQMPAHYPLSAHPIPPPSAAHDLNGLEGFGSPYLGHTGSWNGRGGSLGGTKLKDMDHEVAMGLRWTFMPVYWRVLEPDGPVDPTHSLPPAWEELDRFVIAAQARGLNILMQAPVVGGNAGGPPAWAGRRQPKRSAPADLEALAAFAGKLAARYRPGGTLAMQSGWGATYGVRAWELDNEPESYFTNWKGQAADYTEFVQRAAAHIKRADPHAFILAPGMAAGPHGTNWLLATLTPDTTNRSPASAAARFRGSLGPIIDGVSFHNYEGLDSAFAGQPRTIAQVFDDVRSVVEAAEQSAPEFTYHRHQEYWHTEGNYDFIGALSAKRRAAWRFQFFTRAFACGIRKVCVMDASPPERTAVKTYVATLPHPFPMLPALDQIVILQGQAHVFRHPDGPEPQAGQVWIAWAEPGGAPAQIDLPVQRTRIALRTPDGATTPAMPTAGRLRLTLPGDAKMPAPVLVVDRP